MPFINGRFHINPAHGRAIEKARLAEVAAHVTSVDSNGIVHAIAAHRDVVGPDDKFNSNDTRRVTYRRFGGGQLAQCSVCIEERYHFFLPRCSS